MTTENQDSLITAQKAALDKAIADSFPLVGEEEELTVLESEFQKDEAFLKKIKNMAESYNAVRRTRPDGNCFYRAFAFRYFQILSRTPSEFTRFKAFVTPAKDEMVKLGMPQFTVEDFYDTFMDLLDKAGAAETDEARADVENTFNDQGMSDYIVVYLRLLTSKQLQLEAEFYQNFLEDGRTVSEFCGCDVEPMYQESDNIHIIALMAATGVKVRIMYLDRGEREKAVAHDFPEDGPEPLVHLLYRPGHYDVLYPKE